MVRVGADQWVGLEVPLGGGSTLLVLAVQRSCGGPSFCSWPSEMTVGLWPFSILLMIGPTEQVGSYF